MHIIRGSVYKLWGNFIRSFSGTNWLWHLLAIAITYACVRSDLDWWYYRTFDHGLTFRLLFPAAIIGFIVPILLPLSLLIFGRQDPKTLNTGFATAQAAFLGWLVSALYKTVTGRVPPPLSSNIWSNSTVVTNLSHKFQFGLLRGGIFWGWPSSHTTVAFAIAAAVIVLHRKNKLVVTLACLYALYLGFGVSVSIHWFSDFVAGAIIGTVIGLVVGQSFKQKLALTV